MDDVEKSSLKQAAQSGSFPLENDLNTLSKVQSGFISLDYPVRQVLQKVLSRQEEDSFITLTSAAKDGDADMVISFIAIFLPRGRRD